MKLTDGFDLIDPASYAANGPPHESWTALRRHSPVHRCEPRDYPPFWAITRHAHICEISKQPDKFLNQTGITHQRTHETIDRSEGIGAMRTIIEMDPPEHRGFRKVASPWFTPRALDRIDAAVQASARALVDGLAGRTGAGECDFARDVATAHPLRILSTILGVPRAEEPRILRLTNQIFAFEDTELQRPGESREQAIRELGLELYQLFAGIIEDRRRNPRDDLATVLANGRVNGEPMGPLETFGYYLITFTAGHDTTKNALAGGMHALLQNPDELAKLRRDPGLVKPAVEEVVRWASPVNYMRRRAACDTEVGGQRIRKGDWLILFYASGNRDEDVFDDPFCFRVDRDPNPHVGFGHGEHFCLGSHLARRSQRALFAELARRLEHVELAGEPAWIQSSFVVGLKHLPIRYRIARGA
ncbi:MAG TPA: cytochrome P450 [Burkholderiales bacterium]|nr:cytochrome P450 [Burkholderiales bacterium]